MAGAGTMAVHAHRWGQLLLRRNLEAGIGRLAGSLYRADHRLEPRRRSHQRPPDGGDSACRAAGLAGRTGTRGSTAPAAPEWELPTRACSLGRRCGGQCFDEKDPIWPCCTNAKVGNLGTWLAPVCPRRDGFGAKLCGSETVGANPRVLEHQRTDDIELRSLPAAAVAPSTAMPRFALPKEVQGG